MVGIADQIQLAAEHASKIVTDISTNRDELEALALLRPYLFAFEREIATLELRQKMRQTFGKLVSIDCVPRHPFKVINGGAA